MYQVNMERQNIMEAKNKSAIKKWKEENNDYYEKAVIYKRKYRGLGGFGSLWLV